MHTLVKKLERDCLTYGEQLLWPVACYCLHTNYRGDQFGEATKCWRREHSVYVLSAAIISLNGTRVTAKLICGGGLKLTPPLRVQGKLVKLMLRQVFNSKNYK